MHQKQTQQLTQESSTLAQSITEEHGHEVTTIASLLTLTRSAFNDLGGRYNVSLTPLLDAQRRYVTFWMEHHGVSPESVDAAISGLTRAGVTLQYLAALPA